jgi:hypothetical protein
VTADSVCSSKLSSTRPPFGIWPVATTTPFTVNSAGGLPDDARRLVPWLSIARAITEPFLKKAMIFASPLVSNRYVPSCVASDTPSTFAYWMPTGLPRPTVITTALPFIASGAAAHASTVLAW